MNQAAHLLLAKPAHVGPEVSGDAGLTPHTCFLARWGQRRGRFVVGVGPVRVAAESAAADCPR